MVRHFVPAQGRDPTNLYFHESTPTAATDLLEILGGLRRGIIQIGATKEET
jgi:hypothetical protein